MPSKVYFFTARTLSAQESMSKVKGPLSLKNLGIEQKVKPNDLVVIKSHFGALENVRYLRPSYLRFLCDYVKQMGAKPTVAESCGWGLPESVTGTHTEYSGRNNEKEYLEVALAHGFTRETMGAPIIMLDGPNGIDFEIQQIKGKRFNEVLVAGRLREFDHLIIASHFKGHVGAGIGGAIKNLGIGCVSKGGKTQAHQGKKFEMDEKKCSVDCNACVKLCPAGALSKSKDKKLVKDWSKCKYCYYCASICKNKVFNLGGSNTEEFITQLVDNALGVVEYFGRDNIYYINYALDITWQCDCTGGSDTPIVPDLGVLSSTDPVALDQATVDLIHLSLANPYSIVGDIVTLSKQEKNEWFSYTPRFKPDSGDYDLNRDGKVSKNWDYQLKVAEEAGLGTRNYELIEVNVEKPEKK